MDSSSSSPESDRSACEIMSYNISNKTPSLNMHKAKLADACPVSFHRRSPSDGDTSSPQPPQEHQHHGPQPISPPPPSPQISAAELLLLTEASATNNGTFQCTLCSKQFGYKNGLIRHVRLTHVGEKPYLCSICNRRFGYKHILMEHQNLHFGNRPYACTLCDKRFAARSNLIQHRMVHRRPFNCALCSKRFDREDQLKKHLFAHPQTHVAASCNPKDNNVVSVSESLHGHVKLEDKTLADDFCASSPRTDGPPSNMLTSRQQSQAGSVGHRIDSLCSPENTTVSSSYAHVQMSYPTRYQDVVVKKEVTDAEYPDIQQSKSGGNCAAETKHQRLEHVCTTDVVSSDRPTEISSVLGAWTSEVPRLTAVTTSKRQSSYLSPAAAASLPGIHEMFSRRAAGHKLPSFADFMPTSAGAQQSALPTTDLTVPFMSSTASQPINVSQQSSSAPFSSVASSVSGIVTPTQRPTAQLPPIAQTVVRSTKDQAVQHSHTVTGFPSLDDVLAYYVSQGRLFRCQHCSILFFERGMYFLHASLHGLASPWECSICHKVCSDKNEFTLHFVNQQHHP